MKKRVLCALVAACMLAALLAVPVSAAETVRFSDIQDQDITRAVESLRLMGVLDGYGDGTFRPNAALNRAQFCKMLTYAMNGADELGLYNTVTVFPDVKPSHWAAGYINMAARKGVISGYPDGKFHPERTVTLGHAVTMLLRLLEYKDENIGGIWPASYVAQASRAGLTDGVGTDGSAPLTRGQAARLFLNLLRAEKREGGAYIADIGTEQTDVVLVTASATGSDGRDNWLKIDDQKDPYQLASGKTSSGALNGCKGTLVTNKDGKVITFIPDDLGRSVVITVAKAAELDITDVGGTKYSVAKNAKVYLDGTRQDWREAFSWIHTGSSVTLYLNAAGSVEYVMAGGGEAADKAVIVYKNASTEGFADLAGTASGYKIFKNGVAALAKDMREYDVATWSASTNSIRVCDNKITGFYETCSPSPDAPSKLTVLGYEFDVLPTAAESVKKFKPGNQITLLLTEDNQVAGVVEAKANIARGNIIGIARELSSGSATVDLLCGISVSGSTTQSEEDLERLSGQLVQVSSNKRGYITLTRLARSLTGGLDVAARTLGSRKLADNVMIFENDADGGIRAVSLSDLPRAVYSRNEIAYSDTDWADRVRVILIGTQAGSAMIFGRAVFVDGHESIIDKETGEEYKMHGNNSISLQAGKDKTYGPYVTNYRCNTGDYLGLSITGSGDHKRIGAMVRLSPFKDVPNYAWSGKSTVLVSGKTYTVSEDVLCYNRTTKDWVSLTEAHAYAGVSDIYVYDGVVRVVEVH